MASSTCPKCTGTLFEAKENSPNGANYKQIFIQCRSCGCVVGVAPYYDTGVVAKDNQKEISKLVNRLDNIEYTLRQMINKLNSM